VSQTRFQGHAVRTEKNVRDSCVRLLLISSDVNMSLRGNFPGDLTDRVSGKGTAIGRVRPSVCLFSSLAYKPTDFIIVIIVRTFIVRLLQYEDRCITAVHKT